MVDSKSNHAVRDYGFHYRYDPPDEGDILAALGKVVSLKLNLFNAIKKPIDWTSDATGKRIYDIPTTPYQRLKDSGSLSQLQLDELESLYRSINPAQLTRQILTSQDRLVSLAKDKILVMAAEIEAKQQERLVGQNIEIKIKAS